MSELVLPGDIEGLLRRCSPVIGASETVTGSGVIYEVTARDVVVFVESGHPGGTQKWGALFDEVALDLTDATGRAHAAWWLWLDDEDTTAVPCTTPEWLYCPDGVWSLGASVRDCPGQVEYVTYGPPGSMSADYGVPSLADLDPNDPRLLDDGSRWVDAEALRRVVLHVAGRDA